jgi:hypothetical protein
MVWLALLMVRVIFTVELVPVPFVAVNPTVYGELPAVPVAGVPDITPALLMDKPVGKPEAAKEVGVPEAVTV